MLLASSVIDHLAKRDRVVIIAGLSGTLALSWLYLVWMARAMGGASPVEFVAPVKVAWTSGYTLMTFFMWTVMMVAMMVPSVAPMILTFASVNRARSASGGAFVPTWIFLLGYLAAWTAFSVLATGVQGGLHAAALLAPATLTVGPYLGGGLLVMAGLYQWTPLKARCLSRCATPLDFILTEWRDGAGGAWIMGVRHGLYCVGCCAFLMLLLFVAGVMNLVWVGILAGIVLFEKLLPSGQAMSRGFGFLFVLAGIGLAARSFW